MLCVGAGELAPRLIAAHRTVRPSIARVLIWNRTAGRAAALAATLQKDGIAAEPAADLDRATAAADLVTTCTRSHAPLIKGALSKHGAHVDLVGGYTPETRESDDETVKRALIFVDDRDSAMGVVGDQKRRPRRKRGVGRSL
jgi:ornithine cyclodeaminase/alanine dehydrogenase-like protein (mu-crystallin family)